MFKINHTWSKFVIILGLIMLVSSNCKKESLKKESLKTLSTLTASAVTNITTNSATAGGTVTADGGAEVTSRGVCWSSANSLPTTSDSKTTDGSGLGVFSSSITGLTAGTTYNIRAYATNSVGTAYGNQVAFSTNKLLNSNGTDSDGNIYASVIIGSQVWMTSNLKTTKLNDGIAIPFATNWSQWWLISNLQYSWPNYIATNKEIYGALYSWNTVSSGKLCPVGWHVPSESDWSTLITFLGGESIAGGKLKVTGTSFWSSPNLATNETGFSALPVGRNNETGNFMGFGPRGYWWSSTYYKSNIAWDWEMLNDQASIKKIGSNVLCGLSVRCIKD